MDKNLNQPQKLSYYAFFLRKIGSGLKELEWPECEHLFYETRYLGRKRQKLQALFPQRFPLLM